MKAVGKTVAWTATCCTLVAGFEGCWTTARVDTIGTGRPVTWCHGETEGPVKVGQHFTKAECAAMLTAKLPRYWGEIAPCIHVPTSNNEKIAYTSIAYNIGSRGVCRSAMVKRLNAGDHKGACNALLMYDHAQGRQVRGLTNRRVAERKICLTPDAKRSTFNPPVAVPTPHIAPAPSAPTPPHVTSVKPAASHWWSKLFSWAWWTS